MNDYPGQTGFFKNSPVEDTPNLLQLLEIFKRNLDLAGVWLMAMKRPTEDGFSIFLDYVPPAAFYRYELLIIGTASELQIKQMNYDLKFLTPNRIGIGYLMLSPSEFEFWAQNGHIVHYALTKHDCQIFGHNPAKKKKFSVKYDINKVVKSTNEYSTSMLSKAIKAANGKTKYEKVENYDQATYQVRMSVHYSLCSVLAKVTGIKRTPDTPLNVLYTECVKFCGIPEDTFNRTSFKSLNDAYSDVCTFGACYTSEKEYFEFVGLCLYVIAYAKRYIKQHPSNLSVKGL